jgi:tetratricopeptide (TPR) repeat protein
MEEKDKKPEPEVRKPDALDPMAEKPTSTYDYGDRMVVEVNHLYNLGKYYEASVWVEELIRKRPKYTRAYIMKGSLMWVQGHKDIAKKTWEEALNLEPNNDEVKTLLERFK